MWHQNCKAQFGEMARILCWEDSEGPGNLKKMKQRIQPWELVKKIFICFLKNMESFWQKEIEPYTKRNGTNEEHFFLKAKTRSV